MSKAESTQLDVQKTYRHEYLVILKSIGNEMTLPKGKQLRNNDLYYLLQGICSLCIEGENGKDVVLVYFMPGRIINFLPALKGFYPYSGKYPIDPIGNQYFFVKAISNCRLLHIDHKKFLEKYFDSLPLHSLIVQGLVENCYALFSHLFNSMQNPAWQRVAGILLHLMDKNPPHFLERRITYEEISTFLCIHPVTVAKIFRALLEAGIIARNKKIIRVCDPDRLERIAQGREHLFYKRRKDSDGE